MAAASAKTAANEPHNRRTAKVKLQEARTALDNRQFEQAEAIALEVKRWGLTYGLFEDNPDKVAAAARALRRRDKIRNTTPREQSSQGVYDILVQESRQLMSVGKLDLAEAKARQAQRMNVVPPLTADRAEAVLHEIAMARATTGVRLPIAARTGRGEADASVKMEREANELLAKGDQNAAAAKYSEAERLSAGESLLAVSAKQSVPDRPASDPAVQQIAATGPGPMHPTWPRRWTIRPAPQPSRLNRRRAPVAPQEPAIDPVQATTAVPLANRGEQLLGEAKELYKNGNYQAAKKLAVEAKTGKFGVEAQADELIAQIALAEQGGALSLYEAALAALRSGDNGRARALLTEVAAAGDSLDDSMRAKVENLLQKLIERRKRPARRQVEHPRSPGCRGTRSPTTQRRGRNQDRRGSAPARNRPGQGDRDLRKDRASRAGCRTFARIDPADGPPAGSCDRARQER